MNIFDWAETDDLINGAAREAYAIWIRYTGEGGHNYPWWEDLGEVDKTAWRAIARQMMLRGMKLQKAETDATAPSENSDGAA